MYIILYLIAIVLANLSSTYFGPYASILNAFLFIGFDLSSRDKLHELWKGNNLAIKMAVLIFSGSLLSFIVNKNSGPIAVASFVAFLVSAIIDTIVYQLLHKKSFLVKANGSNIFSALADSIIFPTIAFGGFLPIITLGQFLAKVVGGALWSFILNKRKKV